MGPEHYTGITRFVLFWPDAPMVRETFDALVREAEAENDAVIDAAKGMLECTCRVIIEECDGPKNEQLNNRSVTLQQLMAETNKVLKVDDGRHRALEKLASSHINLAKKLCATELVDDISAASRAKVDELCEVLKNIADELENEIEHDRSLAKLVSKHANLGKELNSIRNKAGPLSHGKSGFLEPLAASHLKKAVVAADTIIDFYHSIYQQVETNFEFTNRPYENFVRENKVIDTRGVWGVEVSNGSEGEQAIALTAIGGITVVVPVSEFLFKHDRPAYAELRAELNDHHTEEEET